MNDLWRQPAFKPGAATWNTDDPDQQPWLKNKKPKHGAKKEAAAAPEAAAPPVPTAYLTSAKLTKSIHTTGSLAPVAADANYAAPQCTWLAAASWRKLCTGLPASR